MFILINNYIIYSVRIVNHVVRICTSTYLYYMVNNNISNEYYNKYTSAVGSDRT